MRSFVSRLAALLIFAGCTMMAGGSDPAGAAASHYGTDPYYSGCSGNSFEYTSWPIVDMDTGANVSTVRVRYSRTCGTNWIVVDGNPYGGDTLKTLTADNAPGVLNEYDWGTGWSYSMQVYAPGSTCIYVAVHLMDTSGEFRASSQREPYWDQIC